MFFKLFFILIFLNFQNIFCQNQSLPVNEIEQCRLMYDGKRVTHDYLKEFPTGLGVGWDNLQNIPRSDIFDLTFSKCNLSPDLEYLVPDGVKVIPIKTSKLDRIAEYYESYQEYSESTSQSINVGASVKFDTFGISGSYSDQMQQTKKHSVGEQSAIFRSKLEHHAYTALVEPGTSLNANFRKRLADIGEALLKNQTQLAKYLSQLVIRDYGTHVITNADVGAIMVQEDFIDSKALSQQNIYVMKCAAAVTFALVANINVMKARSISDDDVAKYTSMKRHGQYTTFGGPDVNRLLKGNATESLMKIDDLVILDRSGVPIYFLANKDHFPSLPMPTVAAILTQLRNATEEYYTRNAIFGCQDMGAKNFNYRANVDDDSCVEPKNNYTFGGLYQTCVAISGDDSICRAYEVKNGVTGGFSCPQPYAPHWLFRTTHYLPLRHEQHCINKDYDCGWWLHHHTCTRQECYDETFTDVIVLDAYWCSAGKEQVPADSGYLFGGLYTSRMSNPFSSNQGCPGHFKPYTIGVDLSVCMSRDFQLDYESSLTFGGFFGCGSSQVRCEDPAYSQHLAEIIDGCEIYYCVRPDAFAKPKITPLNMPPYMDYPYEQEMYTVLQSYQDGRLWYRSTENNRSWTMMRVMQADGKLPNAQLLMSKWAKQSTTDNGSSTGGNGSSTGGNGGFIASVVLNCLAVVALAIAVVYLVRKKYVTDRVSYGPIGLPEALN